VGDLSGCAPSCCNIVLQHSGSAFEGSFEAGRVTCAGPPDPKRCSLLRYHCGLGPTALLVLALCCMVRLLCISVTAARRADPPQLMRMSWFVRGYMTPSVCARGNHRDFGVGGFPHGQPGPYFASMSCRARRIRKTISESASGVLESGMFSVESGKCRRFKNRWTRNVPKLNRRILSGFQHVEGAPQQRCRLSSGVEWHPRNRNRSALQGNL